MMRTTVETAGEDGGDGDGLGGSPMNALTEGVLDAITPRQRSDTPSVEQKTMLADLTMGDILARKAGGGRRPKTIREIPCKGPIGIGHPARLG